MTKSRDYNITIVFSLDMSFIEQIIIIKAINSLMKKLFNLIGNQKQKLVKSINKKPLNLIEIIKQKIKDLLRKKH